MTPNPRLVSKAFMARTHEEFKPATTLNLLAAAWIQFQVHDWMMHPFVSPSRENSRPVIDKIQSDEKVEVPLAKGDKWVNDHMELYTSLPDAIRSESDQQCPGYINTNTPWWDLSQVYGSDEATTQRLRTHHHDGKLQMVTTSSDPGDIILGRFIDGKPATGFNENWWTGIELLHTLFAREHNYLCGMLRRAYPDWTGYERYVSP